MDWGRILFGAMWMILRAVFGLAGFLLVVWTFAQGPESASIGNAAFAAVAASGALAFTWAQALDREDPARAHATRAGEKLSLSAILFIAAYMARVAAALYLPADSPVLGPLLHLVGVFVAFSLFVGLAGGWQLTDALIARVASQF